MAKRPAQALRGLVTMSHADLRGSRITASLWMDSHMLLAGGSDDQERVHTQATCSVGWGPGRLEWMGSWPNGTSSMLNSVQGRKAQLHDGQEHCQRPAVVIRRLKQNGAWYFSGPRTPPMPLRGLLLKSGGAFGDKLELCCIKNAEPYLTKVGAYEDG
jgi:hypothetical protein